MKAPGKGISLVINAKNEEDNIQGCIDSARKVVNEVIVVDMASSDRTREIAKELGAQVYKVKDYGIVEPARDFAISKASNDWVLLLDADERVRPPLAEQIRKIVAEDRFDVVKVPRKNIVFGKWMRYTRRWPDQVAKLFKKNYISWPKGIHAEPICRGKIHTLPLRETNAILHLNYASVGQFVERTNRHTSYEKELFKRKKLTSDEMFGYYEGEFAHRFFHGKGYLDGLHGFFLSKLMEFYKFLELAKYWEKTGYKDIIGSNNLKAVVEKHLENTGQISEIDRLYKEVQRLNAELKIIQSAKAYQIWQFYCKLRDKLLGRKK